MFKLLAVIGWILLGLLILLLWVIIVPRSVFVEYTNADSIVVKVRIFLFKIKVYPLPKFLTGRNKKDYGGYAQRLRTCKRSSVNSKGCNGNSA